MDQDNTVPSVLMQEKVCSVCKVPKAPEAFYVLKGGKLSSRCRECTRQQVKNWAKANPERAAETRREKDRRRYHTVPGAKEKSNIKSKARYHRLKQLVIAAYGGPRCACCGVHHEEFLTIDHVNNDGKEHRSLLSGGDPDGNLHGNTGRLFAWLRSHNYPEGFQILCYNCNFGRAKNGGICPHKNEGVEAIPYGSTPEWAEAHATLPVTYGC